MNKALIALVTLSLSQFAMAADHLDAHGLLRSTNGQLRMVMHWDAVNACPNGTRLMTAREFAVEAQANGAKIMEVANATPSNTEGYSFLETTKPDGTKDNFYFNTESYKAPAFLKKISIWTSSYFNIPGTQEPILFGADSPGMEITNIRRDINLVVRCIASPPRADIIDKEGFLRNQNGIKQVKIQAEAIKACPTGTHLPTTRELARMAESLGAQGILEVSQVNPANVPPGYSKFSVRDLNGSPDEFYFSENGFKNPAADLGKSHLWSSSVQSASPDSTYNLSLLNGWLVDAPTAGVPQAVKCFAN